MNVITVHADNRLKLIGQALLVNCTFSICVLSDLGNVTCTDILNASVVSMPMILSIISCVCLSETVNK